MDYLVIGTRLSATQLVAVLPLAPLTLPVDLVPRGRLSPLPAAAKAEGAALRRALDLPVAGRAAAAVFATVRCRWRVCRAHGQHTRPAR
jgi:hypothetical protein